jgi:MoaA/NifB/PqqE/SkfB family radical SAM enzyme
MATVLITFQCGNNCVFCGAAGKRGGDHGSGRLGADVVEAWLRRCAALGVRLVAFSGAGDPLAHPDFIRLVQATIALGMRPYAYTQAHFVEPRAVKALVGAGLREIAVSLHGASDSAHEAATRHPGSFACTLRGLRVLLDGGLRVQTNSVVTRFNLAEALPLVEFLAGRIGVHEMAFSYPRAEGNALTHSELFATFREVARALRPALARLRAMGKDVTVENVPPCHLAPEEYLPLPDYEVMYKDEQHDLCLRPSQVEMHYPPACDGCSLRRVCPGVDRAYPFPFAAGPYREPHDELQHSGQIS